MLNNPDGIVLLAKSSGPTSFSSLHDIKSALDTTKVGHTGTLDSFAQGLLVVCTGRLTKLAGNITEFNKSYKAVIRFGVETDTDEFTGNITTKTALPDLESLKKNLNAFTGEIMQTPPGFSAIHVNGKRSSELIRSGEKVEIPARPVTVYKAELLEVRLNQENKVTECLIDFDVSKGTYIRSIARDLGRSLKSSATLLGLYRTKVGNFKVEDAAGFNKLPVFTISSALENEKQFFETLKNNNGKIFLKSKKDLELQEEIRNKIKKFDEETASLCGFTNIHLKNEEALLNLQNGRNIKNKDYEENLFKLPVNQLYSVFYNQDFCGLLEKNENERISYKFVIN